MFQLIGSFFRGFYWKFATITQYSGSLTLQTQKPTCWFLWGALEWLLWTSEWKLLLKYFFYFQISRFRGVSEGQGHHPTQIHRLTNVNLKNIELKNVEKFKKQKQSFKSLSIVSEKEENAKENIFEWSLRPIGQNEAVIHILKTTGELMSLEWALRASCVEATKASNRKFCWLRYFHPRFI